MNNMTLDEMIMAEIERVPRTKQTELQQKYIDLYKEKEHYRFDAVYQEQRAEKWQKAYERLNKKYQELLEKEKCNTKQ